MATFEEQVEGITGLTIGTTPAPSSNVFTDILREGVRDVVNKMVVSRPQEIVKFAKTTNSITNVTKIGAIVSIVREHDSTSILRPCTRISPGDRYEATDSDSLKYRSKYNPGYYELDGKLYCVPDAGSGNNDIVVTQVAYDTGLIGGDTYGGGNIDNFPTDYEQLVVLYASIKILETAAGNKTGAQDIELQTSYSNLANSFKGEYMAAFQTQQPQQGAQSRR